MKSKETVIMNILDKYINLSYTIEDEFAKDKESELFLAMDSSRAPFEKAVAFKKWKDHVIKYSKK